ncbi:aspartyl-tRNA amidotransferase [Kyrpidia spormannii]|uniref:Aspartyl-tRNA amidotransferase n=1 Tax=Kyrpidia spormannii TaxID=2055160 RepID=A0A2K8N7K5_9BACL|nr:MULTISPECIES: GatB/YqeY domain-containing protein [Kyrpidia]ATY84432.1 aspartyl-tRNA amidotransferase [Kyrpidia spormannii]MCL6575982.1 GatB/YqeY domain-containing protein [Kyrpidia sp.]
MNVQDRLTDDMKRAMKEKDKIRLSVIRMVRTALKNEEIERQRPLTEEETIQVLQRERKQRRESLQAAQQAGRTDLEAQAQREIAILEEYLPTPLSEEELRGLVEETIAEVGAKGKADLGRVMAALMPKVKGRADGKAVNALVQESLRS